MSFSYEYPRPAVTVDTVVFGYQEQALWLLLIERGIQPFKGEWALPGGFVRVEENLEEAAYRELKEEAGVSDVYLEQLYTFGRVDRDPRERVISVSYFALVKPSTHEPVASTDAIRAKWFRFDELPKLAFDHKEIVATALTRLRNKARYEPIGFELLPKAFTLTQLQDLYETLAGEKMDKRNFRKKILATGVLKETDKKLTNVAYRAPQLYKFDAAKYKTLSRTGFKFEI
jgi:8-oxo-dGTP diphosphatase